MWERPEVRTAAGELVAGTEDRLEVGTELRGLTQDPPPLLKRAAGFGRVVGLRWVWEVGRGAPGLARPQSQGKGWG